MPHFKTSLRIFLALAGVSASGLACGGSWDPVVVSQAHVDLTNVSAPVVGDAARLMENLARSPLWGVRSKDGTRSAFLRVATNADPFTPQSMFLGAWIRAGHPPFGTDSSSSPAMPITSSPVALDSRWQSAAVVDLGVEVLTEKPAQPASAWGVPVDLGIYSTWSKQVDGNAWTTLVLQLGGVWLVIREQGAGDRSATRAALDVALDEIARVATLPDTYLARDIYADVFAVLGKPPAPLRYAGIQDRDTLGLVFETQPGFDYQHVQVDVGEPKICGGECTDPRRQADKAVDLGHPPPGDWALVVVPDNAVFLDAEQNARYGTFSGSDAFDAEIRWADAAGRPIWVGHGPFRGWER